MAENDGSDVLTIRVPRDLSRKLTREARRRRQSRSAVARAILIEGLSGRAPEDPDAEARRQSLLVREHESEYEVLRFIAGAADLKGWK
jgi:metal-responsive CopG/Arc/MetJ family transcriptional regulator